MKKILLLLLLFVSFTSCNKEYNTTYTLKYIVFYPTGPDTVIVSNVCGFDWFSQGGTNYIKELDGDYLYSGTCPYKIIEYTVE